MDGILVVEWTGSDPAPASGRDTDPDPRLLHIAKDTNRENEAALVGVCSNSLEGGMLV